MKRLLKGLLAPLAVALCPALAPASTPPAGAAEQDAALMAETFRREVDRRLEVPAREQEEYARQLAAAFGGRPGLLDQAQFVVAVDRHPRVQALLLYLAVPGGRWLFVGAAPVSTGLPGRVDYFLTPLGIFAHGPDNPDFRAEGTRNKLGILGYGVKGMRVFDLGWQQGERGWGGGGWSQMRLQMHATDPRLLEPLLGTPRSKGCIRIPASLNRFLDRYGILDAEYDRAQAQGRRFWVLQPDRQPTPWAGRHVVVLETRRQVRPHWSPAPALPAAALLGEAEVC